MNAVEQRLRRRWIAAVSALALACGAMLLGACGPGVAEAYSKPAFTAKMTERGVVLDREQDRALNVLATVFDRQEDLRDAFGEVPGTDVRSLLEWATNPDREGNFPELAEQRAAMRRIVEQWDALS